MSIVVQFDRLGCLITLLVRVTTDLMYTIAAGPAAILDIFCTAKPRFT